MTGHSDNCRFCAKPLPADRRRNRVYCSTACQREDLKKKWAAQNPKSPLGAFNAGTIAEANVMRVSIDLLARGYGVYRAAFNDMPIDLLVVHPTWGVGDWPDPPQRVKVTAGSRTPKGTVTYAAKVTDVDMLAIVMSSGEIVYRPEIDA